VKDSILFIFAKSSTNSCA